MGKGHGCRISPAESAYDYGLCNNSHPKSADYQTGRVVYDLVRSE
ncbi:hypothetical protein [Oceanobacillus neutriphilus]|nr:hypothetical protein [Oceanobacillus neutriphilus]